MNPSLAFLKLIHTDKYLRCLNTDLDLRSLDSNPDMKELSKAVRCHLLSALLDFISTDEMQLLSHKSFSRSSILSINTTSALEIPLKIIQSLAPYGWNVLLPPVQHENLNFKFQFSFLYILPNVIEFQNSLVITLA